MWITALIELIVLVAVVYAAIWIIDTTLPDPLKIVTKILVGLLALIAIVHYIGII